MKQALPTETHTWQQINPLC